MQTVLTKQPETKPAAAPVLVFVYGTLQRGYWNHRLLDGETVSYRGTSYELPRTFTKVEEATAAGCLFYYDKPLDIQAMMSDPYQYQRDCINRIAAEQPGALFKYDQHFGIPVLAPRVTGCTVRGELYTLDPELVDYALSYLDSLEGVSGESNLRGPVYHRRKIEVTTASGETVEAWAYVSSH